MGRCYVLQLEAVMKLGVSQTLKSCLNIGGWSVLGIFHLPHTVLLQALLRLAFFCCRLIYMDNINRAAITSGFLSAESMVALPGKRPRKEKMWGQDICFPGSFPAMLLDTNFSLNGSSLYLSSQPSVSFDKYIYTEKHHHRQDKNKKFLMSPLHSISPSWPQEIIVLFFGVMN